MRRTVGLLMSLALVAACGGAGTTASADSPSAATGGGNLVVASLGGSYQEAQSKAFMQPFAQQAGVKVTETAAEGVAKLKAMVESGNVEWDIVDLGPQELQLATQEGLLEPIDWNCER